MHAPPTPPPARRSGSVRQVALILSASLLSAAIASGATTLALAPSVFGPTTTPIPSGAAGVTAVSVTPAPAAAVDAVSPVVDVAARVSPAVVTITTSGQVTRGPFSVPSSGVGSGVIIRADGWILTNDHVVEGASQLVVTLRDGTELPGRVAATDRERDLAVVKVDGSDLPTAELGASADLQVGQLVVAIGSPLGQFSDTVTSGILSAIGRTIEVPDPQTGEIRRLEDLLQTDAAINPGNSGGPLLDGAGRVIGINTAIASSADGIGFAVPIDTAQELLERVLGSPSA